MCFDQGCDGRATDAFVCGIGVNLISRDIPALPVEMRSLQDLEKMLKAADDAHIFVDGGVFHINAVYRVTDRFPAARIYFVKTEDLLTVGSIGLNFEKQGIHLHPIDKTKFSRLIDDQEYAKRYDRWKERFEENGRAFRGLLAGRLENTAVDQGIWLSSDGRCAVCGDACDRMSTSTVIGKSGLMIGLQLCERHEAEAHNHPKLILGYLADKMGISAPFFVDSKVVQHGKQTVEMTCEAVQTELACKIEKVDGQTITAVRKSGFRIILRQDSLHDYAYNIQSPQKKPVSRIDSADHHSVNYGPAHVHRNLSKSKKNQVESSFTYGFAVADLKVIRRLVEDAESQWSAIQGAGNVPDCKADGADGKV